MTPGDDLLNELASVAEKLMDYYTERVEKVAFTTENGISIVIRRKKKKSKKVNEQ